MDDLISRVAACECIGKMIHEYREKDESDLADGMILARRYGIKRLPAVNAAPVVRCGDCKYWYAEIGASTGWLPCQEIATDRNWFCASGKRRESE